MLFSGCWPTCQSCHRDPLVSWCFYCQNLGNSPVAFHKPECQFATAGGFFWIFGRGKIHLSSWQFLLQPVRFATSEPLFMFQAECKVSCFHMRSITCVLNCSWHAKEYEVLTQECSAALQRRGSREKIDAPFRVPFGLGFQPQMYLGWIPPWYHHDTTKWHLKGTWWLWWLNLGHPFFDDYDD